MSPTPLAAWLLAACAAAALVVPDALAITAFGAVAVATAVDAWMVRQAPELARTVPDVLSRGQRNEHGKLCIRRKEQTLFQRAELGCNAKNVGLDLLNLAVEASHFLPGEILRPNRTTTEHACRDN